MEILIIFAICLLVLGLNCLPFVVGALSTPKNTVYLGTVHWPGDYFSYLSQMAQGKYSFFLVQILHTAERLPSTIIGWQMVWLGKIFAFLGISNIYGYQIAVVVFTLLFLLLTYRLLIFIFPKEQGKRLLAFFFFATSTALFKIAIDNGKVTFSIYEYWYNTGNFLERFPHTPHHVIANNFAVLMMLIAFYWFKEKLNITKQIIIIITSVLSGAILCSITPIHWMLVGGGIGIAVLIMGPVTRVSQDCASSRSRIKSILSMISSSLAYPTVAHNLGIPRSCHPLPFYFKRTIWLLLPVIFYILGGLPVVFYLKNVYGSTGLQLFRWEGYQQLPVSFYLIFVGSGLVIPLAIIGIYNFTKKADFTRIAALSYILFCSLFYFSQIPQKMHITNARFWPGTVYIFIAALAAEGTYYLSGLFGKYKKKALVFLILIYLFSIIPTYIISLREKSEPKLGNAYYYLPKDMYASYLMAEKISPKEALFLVQWPMNLSFPGITGRKVFHAYDPTTLDFATKDKEAYDFFAGNLSEEEMGALLDKYHIDYVLGYWWNPKLDKFGRLKRIYTNPVMAIDMVVR